MKKIILIFSLGFSMLSCHQPAFGSPFKGDYTTEQIRTLWSICFTSLKKKDPSAFPPKQWEVCDCYTDSIRTEETHERFKNLSDDEQYNLSFRVTAKCMTDTGYAKMPKPI